MFKDAGAMWSSVRDGNISSPVSAVTSCKSGEYHRVRT